MKFKPVALAGLLLAVAGCHVVRKVEPVQYIQANNPPVVWVTYTDNSFVPVAGPKIVGDSLFGTWEGLSEPVAISLGEIQTVQARMPAPKRTAMLVTVVGAAAAGVAYTIATAGNSGNPNFSGCGFNKGTPINYCCQVAAGESTKNPNC